MENNYYVYKWQNIDTGEVIYVGQGHGDRYKDFYSRTKSFYEYIKNNECQPIIIYNHLSKEDSLKKESIIVQYYKSLDQCKCNGTLDGYRSMPGKLNPNYNNGNALKATYKNRPELKNFTKHDGLSNGRCRPILMYNDNVSVKFAYIKEAALYMIKEGISYGKVQSIQGAIATSIRKHKKYCNYYFQYLD